MRRTAFFLGSLVVLPLACSTGSDLFGDGEGTSRTSSAAASGTGGASATSTSSTSAPSSTSTGGSTPASSTASEAASTGSGVMVEIPCTNDTCTTGEVCCVHRFDDSLDKCAAPGTCGDNYVPVGCNGPNDCDATEVCCGMFVQNSGYQEIACAPSCNNTSTFVGITMCGDDPGACPSPQSCYMSMFLPPGHSFCQ